jgi:outer membrane murein-binding lipoprotein Lpp
MSSRFQNFGKAALPALSVLSLATVAQAAGTEGKPTHNVHRPSSAATAEAKANERINLLASEVETLKAQLAEEVQARRALEAKADAAATQAVAAQTDAHAARAELSSEINTLPATIKADVAAATPKPGWWGGTKVGGIVFADVSHISQKTPGAVAATSTAAASNGYPGVNGNSIDIKRAYLIFEHTFDPVYSANVTTDLIYDGTARSTQLFLKKAYLQARYADALVIRAGDVELPWVPFAEGVEGYRFVENTLIDRIKYGTTTDTSLNISGQLPVQGLKLGYSVSALDGSGFKAPGNGTSNRARTLDVEGRFNATLGPVTAAVGGYSGNLGKNAEGAAYNHTVSRVNALLAYSTPAFRVGVEYVQVRNYTGVTTVVPVKARGEGYSAFGSVRLSDHFDLFGRYDAVKPEVDVAPSSNKANSATRDAYWNFGLDYHPVPAIDIALVYKRERVTGGLFTTTNGAAAPPTLTPYLASVGATRLSYLTTPNPAPAGNGIIGGLAGQTGTYDELGIFTQYKF